MASPSFALQPDADVETITRVILANRYILIGKEDAGKVAEWAQARGDNDVNLLIIGRTGMGKSTLIQELKPMFIKPVSHFTGPWKKLKDLGWPRPLIIDNTDLGLAGLGLVGEKQERRWIEALNECPAPLVVTAFSNLPGLEGEWLRVELSSESWMRRFND